MPRISAEKYCLFLVWTCSMFCSDPTCLQHMRFLKPYLKRISVLINPVGFAEPILQEAARFEDTLDQLSMDKTYSKHCTTQATRSTDMRVRAPPSSVDRHGFLLQFPTMCVMTVIQLQHHHAFDHLKLAHMQYHTQRT